MLKKHSILVCGQDKVLNEELIHLLFKNISAQAFSLQSVTSIMQAFTLLDSGKFNSFLLLGESESMSYKESCGLIMDYYPTISFMIASEQTFAEFISSEFKWSESNYYCLSSPREELVEKLNRLAISS